MTKNQEELQLEYATLIGQICIAWNHVEELSGYLLVRYFNNDGRRTFAMMSGMANRSKIDLLKWCAENREKDLEYRELIRYFCSAFVICEENRNIVVHSAVKLEELTGERYIHKWSRIRLGALVKYKYSVKIIKEVLLEIIQTTKFCAESILRATT